MKTIYGLDLGTNSIGWAVIDEDSEEILGTGVRIFQEGVENLGDGEKELSRNASRRQNRGARKQIFRRKLRKRILKKVLKKNGMYPDHDDLQDWLHLNPYYLRQRAIREKVSLLELGRIFYHLAQRRGFKSNSRGAVKNTDSAIYKGSGDNIGIKDTKENVENHETLGDYLASIYPKPNKPYKQRKEKIRGRFTTRQMYVNEFEKIWQEQNKYHKTLTDDLKENLGGRKEDGYNKDGVIFFQRPLKSQKHLKGKCTFEPTKTKAQKSSIPFEYFRIYQTVNTIRCNSEKLPSDKREKAVEYLLSKSKPKFSSLKKHLGYGDPSYRFNYADDDKIKGSETIRGLSNKKIFGKRWFEFSDKEKEDIWHALYFFDDKGKLKKWVQKHYDLDDKSATEFADFLLVDGYAEISRKAISNILPFLKIGYEYDIAVALGGIKNAFGEQWGKLDEDQLNFIHDNIPTMIRSGVKGGYIDELKGILQDEFDLSKSQLEKLYHHSTNINQQEILEKLPLGKEADKEIQSLRNPVVIRALFELRKVVNELIDRFGGPDEIKVEMARDLKVSKSHRNKIRRQQQRNEKKNDEAIKELKELKQPITHENILKYKLWEECQHIDPYSGDNISLEDLFNDKYQIEHIIPYSRSLDDSYMNKTLCEATINKNKGDKTPYEYFSSFGEKEWLKAKERALSIFYDTKEFRNRYNKFRKFATKRLDDDFISRQLNDTRFISKEAKNYLSKICNDVQVAPGTMTAKLRHHWGLNNIIDEENEEKSRDDHRHHAIDALVMACHSRKHLQKLSRWNRYNRIDPKTGEFPEDVPLPWESFRSNARKSIQNLLVSHDNKDRVLVSRNVKVKKNGETYINKGVAARGQLHAETIYGKRKAPNSSEMFHVRKPIEEINSSAKVGKIVDDTIRIIVLQHLESLGVDTTKKKFKVPKGAFFKKNEDGDLMPQVFLPNKNGEPVPIKKVRIAENLGNTEQLKDGINQHVNPKNNHHAIVYEDGNEKLHEEVVTFWEVVERKKQGLPKYHLPPNGSNIVATLKENDMFVLGLLTGELNKHIKNRNWNIISDHLYRVQKVSSGDYSFRKHIASNLKYKNDEVRVRSLKKYKELNPLKVLISKSGLLSTL
jgi:CRISPR-associated endonuclease Csn1